MRGGDGKRTPGAEQGKAKLGKVGDEVRDALRDRDDADEDVAVDVDRDRTV